MRIIYFDIDCLRPDHLGCYGYNRPTSPTIDEIAKQGVRFDHYYCASSPCLPARAAWSSGRFGDGFALFGLASAPAPDARDRFAGQLAQNLSV